MLRENLLNSLPKEFNTPFMLFLLDNRPEVFHRLRDGILGKGSLEERLFCQAYCRIMSTRFNRLKVSDITAV